jgi:hypothetical protein
MEALDVLENHEIFRIAYIQVPHEFKSRGLMLHQPSWFGTD